MRNCRISLVLAFLVVQLSGLLAWLPIAQAQTRTPLKVGAARYIGEALTFIADEKGFFRDQGLEVQLVINNSGNESFAQLMRGEVDLATVAPLPIVLAAIDRSNPAAQAASPFVIVADTMQSSRINSVLARTDRGIRLPRDLEGKTLALSFGTASEYFWYAFALHHGIDATKVRVVDAAMRDMLKTFEAGAVDAVVAWEPNVEDIRKKAAAPAVIMGGTQIYVTNRMLLARIADFEVVGEAANGREALKLIRALAPEVALMDISMPELNGLDATAHALREQPQLKVIMLSMHATEAHVLEALRAGAAGYLLKDADAGELERAIRAVQRGERYLTPSVSRHVIEHFMRVEHGQKAPEAEGLSPRQREVLQLIAEGRSTREIVERLNLSLKTIETHRAQLMQRLEIFDVAGLTRYALRIGLIDPER